MLLKGNAEINFSSSQKMAFDMLLMRICHLQALPDLRNILLQNSELPKNIVAEKNHQANDEVSDDLVGEILRNFEGAKLVE